VLEVEPQIIEQFVRSGEVKLVYRHLSQIGPASELLAEASECVADQGRFWAMRTAIYAGQGDLYDNTQANVALLADGLGLSGEALNACLAAETHRAMVQADNAAAKAEGIRTRPVFRINDQQLIGAQSFEVFAQAISAALGR
jgi:protein-disulfide isomerase